MFTKKEKQQPPPEIPEKPKERLKTFSELTQQECVNYYNHYLEEIETKYADKNFNVNDFPRMLGDNLVNLISPNNYKFFKFVGVFGESCGIIAYDRILSRYVFLKLALAHMSPNKGSRTAMIWKLNDYDIDFQNPFQKRWARGAKIQYDLFNTMIRDRVGFFIIPGISAHMHPGFFLSMDYIYSLPVIDWAQECSVAKILQMFLKILYAVNYFHSYRIVHRDLKPDNIVIEVNEEDSNFDRPAILDFGLAKFVNTKKTDENDGYRDDITCVGYALGNPLFRSPTQDIDSAQAIYRDDIYTLGVDMWALIHKKYPVVSGGTDLKSRSQKQRWLNDLKKDLPTELQRIFENATNTNDNNRYQTLDPFISDLRSAMLSLGIDIPAIGACQFPVFPENEVFENTRQSNTFSVSCVDCPFLDKCGNEKLITCDMIIKVFEFLNQQ